MISGIKSVVLDTNALLMPFQFRLNIDKEIERLLGPVEILVPSCVIEELGNIAIEEGKAARALAEKYRKIDVKAPGDEGVLEAALSQGAAVVTNDQKLIEILRKSSVPVIRMRKHQYLDFA